MSTTAAPMIKRFCMRKQVMCEYANEFGHCKVTACAYQWKTPNTYGEVFEANDFCSWAERKENYNHTADISFAKNQEFNEKNFKKRQCNEKSLLGGGGMKIVTAPEKYAFDKPKTSVFLAGGITDCYNWQQDVIDHLKYFEQYYPALKQTVIFNPRRDDFDNLSEEEVLDQIKWEHNYLELCDIFTCYFDNSNSVQPITLYELGKYSNNKKNVITVVAGYKRTNDVLIQTALDGLSCYFRVPGEATTEHARTIAQTLQNLRR